MHIDLRAYIVEKVGAWSDNPDAFSANNLLLSNAGDGVALVGPLRLRITLQGENITSRFQGQTGFSNAAGTSLSGGTTAVVVPVPGVSQTHSVYSYLLDIPPLQVWSYLVREPEIIGMLGTNRGFNVVIQPGGSEVCADDYPATPCQPDCTCGGRRGCADPRCRCGCAQMTGGGDLPCDYAVGNIPNLGRFFPAACEPCPSDAYIRVPPLPGPQGLLVRPASGGCERPRYFTGMFVTREDMEAEQRFLRLKLKLHNRAAGDGVVWGLCIDRDGNDLVVHPGYAVDCCGNDLTITSPYRVDIPSLVRDPAAASTLATPGAHRMHLLLEHTECPEDPRPVHGDPCSPQVSSCEMSRIRETARLRLVPPRDFDTSGPIQRFLDALVKIHPIPTPAAPAPGPSPTPLPAPIVPFSLRVSAGQAQDTLEPKLDDSVSTQLRDFQPPVTIVLTAQSGWTITGTVTERVGGGAPQQVGTIGPAGSTWNATAPSLTVKVVDEISWHAETSDGVIMEGATTMNFSQTTNGAVDLRVEVPKTDVKVSKKVVPFPCLTEACTEPGGGLLFPVLPPFLHPDPYKPAEPGDPKVLALAALYGWLAGEIERGDATKIQAAARAYVAASKLLFGVEDPQQLIATAEQLKRLLADWCKVSLYPGPRCQGEPHGVVIGCALVAGGDVQGVDPWGGRRYVVHYPLLAHWGAMFGIAPLDLTAQRFFSLLCCVAGLPGVGGFTRVGGVGTVGTVGQGFARFAGSAAANGGASEIPLGSAVLILRPGVTAADDARLGVTRVQNVGTAEFACRLLDALRQQDSGPAPGSRVRFVAEGLGFSLVVPETAAPAPQPGTVPTVDSGRLRGIADRAVSTLTGDATVPPLLRGVAGDLTAGLLRAQPLTPSEAIAPRLKSAGVDSLGALLARDPEALHRDVLGGENGAELSSLVDKAEGEAQKTATAVAQSLAQLRTRNAATRADLADAATRSVLVNALREQLGDAAPSAAALDGLVLAAAQRSP